MELIVILSCAPIPRQPLIYQPKISSNGSFKFVCSLANRDIWFMYPQFLICVHTDKLVGFRTFDRGMAVMASETTFYVTFRFPLRGIFL
jgi:hypothetical protein